MTTIKHVNADGVSIFYREAGLLDAPVILLLHGFPSSSFQYRNLIPILAAKYRVIAPDLPGFGFTLVPDERKYVYSFESFKITIAAFVDALQLKTFAMYIFDYGAPTGLRYVSLSNATEHEICSSLVQARARPAGERVRDHLAERKRVHRKSWRFLGAHQEVLGRSICGEPRSHSFAHRF